MKTWNELLEHWKKYSNNPEAKEIATSAIETIG